MAVTAGLADCCRFQALSREELAVAPAVATIPLRYSCSGGEETGLKLGSSLLNLGKEA